MSAAMTELFRHHEDKLLRLFQKKTSDLQESRDLLQDLYESALRNLDSFSLVEDQAAWLFRAAHNRIIDWYRGKSRRDSVSLDKQIDDEGSLLDLLVDDKENLEDAYFRTLLLEVLSEAVEALPEKLRLVIREQALEGRTFRELSEEWGVPQGTLLSRKREAVRLLREALEDFSDVWLELEYS